MKSRNSYSKRDVLVMIGCGIFALANLAAIGSSGRRRAKEVVCSSHLKKWGLIWKHYVDEYERGSDKRRGYFAKRYPGNDWGMVYWWKEIWDGCFDDTGTFGQPGIVMPKTLAKMMLCPEATKTWLEGAENPYAAWDDIEREFNYYCKSSYGINLWVADNLGMGKIGGTGQAFWRTPYVAGAAYAPIMMDAQWRDGDPLPIDSAPPFESAPWTVGDDEMQRFCVNRHNGGVNGVYMDLSVRKIGLKFLWAQKWHREWPEDPYQYQWPAWMANFKDP